MSERLTDEELEYWVTQYNDCGTSSVARVLLELKELRAELVERERERRAAIQIVDFKDPEVALKIVAGAKREAYEDTIAIATVASIDGWCMVEELAMALRALAAKIDPKGTDDAH